MEIVADWLKPIYQYIRDERLTYADAEMDETPLNFLQPVSGNARQGFLRRVSG